MPFTVHGRKDRPSSSVHDRPMHSTVSGHHGRPQARRSHGMKMVPSDDHVGRRQDRPGRSRPMASTQMIRVDAYGVLPSFFIVLMLILALLGVVAHAAAV
jgi:hypothetical protein